MGSLACVCVIGETGHVPAEVAVGGLSPHWPTYLKPMYHLHWSGPMNIVYKYRSVRCRSES